MRGAWFDSTWSYDGSVVYVLLVKRIRVTPRKGSNTWSIHVFDSAESAFYTRNAPGSIEKLGDDVVRRVSIERGDQVEIEWIGSEWVYSGVEHGFDKYDHVRIARLLGGAPPSLKDGDDDQVGYLELYSGWVHPDALRWSTGGTQNGARIFRLTERSRSRFDFNDLFSDNEGEASDSGEKTTSVVRLN